MKIMVYNPFTNKIEKYYRNLNDKMPYTTKLSVKEFRGSSKSDILWTNKVFMQNWSKLRSKYGKPIPVRFAFKRIGEGGHSSMSQHYAGLAMDMGQSLTNDARDRIRNLAISLRIFGYVEPSFLTPTWVHIDGRYGIPACARGGYPIVKLASRGNYVFVLQDALNTLGYNSGIIDGIFGNNTRNAVIKFQKNNKLSIDGIVGCNTWEKLTKMAVGKGEKSI